VIIVNSISLNTVTLSLPSLEKTFEIASKCRFDAVGLWANKGVEQYLQEGHTLKDLKLMLDDFGLQVSEYMAVRKWLKADDAVWDEALEEVRSICSAAQALGCRTVTTPVFTQRSSVQEWMDKFQDVCDVASEYDITIAFEFIAGGKQVRQLDMAWEIVGGIDHPNGGLLIDTAHFHMGQSSIETLKTIPSSKVALVHLADVMDKPIGDLKDKDRLIPGDGVVNLVEIFDAMNQGPIGPYKGFVSVEIFNEEYWNTDPYVIAERVFRGSKRVLSEIKR
jgi:2-keto-myo-inositol isomerase